MTTEALLVLLVGSHDWKLQVQSQCPNTDFTDMDAISASRGLPIGLVVIESRKFLDEWTEVASPELIQTRILLCDGSSTPTPDLRIQPITSIDTLNDVTVGAYLQVEGRAGEPDPGFEEQVLKEDLKEFRIALLDAACQLLAGWQVPTPTSVPMQFDGVAFNEHIGRLQSALSQQASVLLLADSSPEAVGAVSNVGICLYQCEKTVFLATKQISPNMTFRSVTESETFPLDGDDAVVCDDLYLTALLLVVLSMAPSGAEFPRCQCAVDEHRVQIDFPFPLCDPPGLEAGFVEHLKEGISSVLQDFRAEMEFYSSNFKLNLARLRA